MSVGQQIGKRALARFGQGQRPQQAHAVPGGMLRCDPGEIRAAGYQADRMAFALAAVSERCSQDDGMFLGRCETAAQLDAPLQVEEDPPIRRGHVLELAHVQPVPAGGGGPVDGFKRVTGGILAHGFHADGGLQGGAARAAAFPGAPASGNLDGGQRQNRRQNQQDGGVGQEQFHVAQSEWIARAQSGGAQVE